MEKKLKLYIWEHVLTDYTDGMVAILATDLENAFDVFKEKYPDELYNLESFAGKSYKVVTEPEAFYVCGGG